MAETRLRLNKKRDSDYWGRAQELYESGGGRPGLPYLISPVVSVAVKQH